MAVSRNPKRERRRRKLKAAKAKAAQRRNSRVQLLERPECVVHLEDDRWILPISNYLLACAELEPRPLPEHIVRISSDPELWGELVSADYPATHVCHMTPASAPLLELWKGVSLCRAADDQSCTDPLCCCNPRHRPELTRQLREVITPLESAHDDPDAWLRAFLGLAATQTH